MSKLKKNTSLWDFGQLTGSKKVINFLNRMGSCISYSTVEALEIQMATDISERETYTLGGLLRQPNLMTGLAWDNYDQLHVLKCFQEVAL